MKKKAEAEGKNLGETKRRQRMGLSNVKMII
jgi:hypothetical protein